MTKWPISYNVTPNPNRLSNRRAGSLVLRPHLRLQPGQFAAFASGR